MPYICHIDIETFSTVDLPKCGVHKYAEDKFAQILCVGYAFGDKPVNLWIPDEFLPSELQKRICYYVAERRGLCHIGHRVPQALTWHARNGGQFRAHNSQFERIMLSYRPGQQIRFPKTKLKQWVCTAAKAAAHSLPRDLARLARALDTPHKKDEDGRGDMMRITKPRKPSKNNPATRWTPDAVPDKFFNMYTYCIDDVLTERDCDHAVEDLPRHEIRLFNLDQVINDRGWMVDLESIGNVQFLIDKYKEKLQRRCREITGINPTQRDRFAEWVRDQGVQIDNLQAQTITDALKRKDLPQNVRWALRIRSLHEMKAPTKYLAMVRAVCADGALRGMLLFYGAATGRWSGRIVQPQNLFRPVIKAPEIAIEAFRRRSISWIKILWDTNPMKVFASCVRGMLVARPGRDLLCCDFNSIEAVIVAWLSNSKDLLKIFATHGLVYEYTAARMFKKVTDIGALIELKTNHPKKRFLGKIAVLALGYQGGEAAFVKMAKDHGSTVKGNHAEQIKWDWRNENPKIVNMWEAINAAAIAAVENPGTTFKANKLMFRVIGDYLFLRLPSKRRLAYFRPFIRHDELRYWGIDTYTRQWQICSTYGGKLLQNACEGIGRDLLAIAMLKLRKKKIYPILGHTHDEVVTEPKEGEGSIAEVIEIMCDIPTWAKGMPVKADGFRVKRYRK